MLKKYLNLLLKQQSLSREACQEAIAIMLQDDIPAEQIAAFLALMHAKGERVEEILGIIDALQARMQHVSMNDNVKLLDIVGTGGDQTGSINISTAAAILAASCGVRVVKHGNRAVSSLSGSADVLEALHIDINMSASQIATCIDKLGIGFCFAQKFHPTLARLRDIRRHLGIPTVFNLVGPFLNPAQPSHYLIGVFSPDLLQTYADILSQLQLEKSVVVHSMGLDEMSCCGETQIIEVEQGRQKHYLLDPRALGLQIIPREALRGGTAEVNAKILTSALSGEATPIADTLILNAGMAVYLYGLESDLQSATDKVRENLRKGAGLELLRKWRGMTVDNT